MTINTDPLALQDLFNHIVSGRATVGDIDALTGWIRLQRDKLSPPAATYLILATTKAELRAKWKQNYRQCKIASDYEDWYSVGKFIGKMKYIAWLLVNAKEVSDNE